MTRMNSFGADETIMGLKRVVVGSDKNGFEQLLDHGVSGYHVPVDDDRELLRTMNTLLALPLRDRERMGEAAAKRIEQLAPEKVVGQLVEFYQETICSSGNS